MVRLSFCSILVCVAWCSASAAEPGKEDIVRQLLPQSRPQLTRGLGFLQGPTRSATRQIVVEPGREEQVLAETKDLPSVNIRVLFGYDSAVLTPEGAASLKPLGEALADPRLQGSRFLIGGHTDARGSDEYNQALSERRARSVREHLIATYRVSPTQLEAMGFGKRKLADPTRPEDPVNRRVEVVNLTNVAK